MRIATFNVENLDVGSSERNPPLEVRADVLRSNFVRMDAEIICLQEVHGQELPGHTSDAPKRSLDALKQVVAGTKYERYKVYSTLMSDNVPYDVRNLVVLCDPSFNVKVAQYRNSEIEHLKYRKVTAKPVESEAQKVTWERPILHLEIDVPNVGVIHVINLHLKSRLSSNIQGQKTPGKSYEWISAAGWAEGYFLSSLKRVGQALETRLIVDKIFESQKDAKVIVCGDLNAEPGEVPVEAIAGRVENTNNPSLRHTVLTPCSLGIPESIRYSHIHHGQGNLLDHMLISNSMLQCFRQAWVYNENIHDESLPFSFDIKYPESDHAPFVAEFSL